MNRRSFFKTITGVVAGVFAAIVPRKTGDKQKPWRKNTDIFEESDTIKCDEGEIPTRFGIWGCHLMIVTNKSVYIKKGGVWTKIDERDLGLPNKTS